MDDDYLSGFALSYIQNMRKKELKKYASLGSQLAQVELARRLPYQTTTGQPL